MANADVLYQPFVRTNYGIPHQHFTTKTCMERDISILKAKFSKELQELHLRLHAAITQAEREERVTIDGAEQRGDLGNADPPAASPVPSSSFSSNVYDETWVLRYIMSTKGDVAKAEGRVLQALSHRRKKAAWVRVRVGQGILSTGKSGTRQPSQLGLALIAQWKAGS